MILCSDNSLYTGITNDLGHRLHQHRNGKGAKYFRGRHAVKVVYVESGHDRSTASKREYNLKRLNANKKLALITTAINEINRGQQ
jgi:putative endonuclease